MRVLDDLSMSGLRRVRVEIKVFSVSFESMLDCSFTPVCELRIKNKKKEKRKKKKRKKLNLDALEDVII